MTPMKDDRKVFPGSADADDETWLVQYYTPGKTVGGSSASLPEGMPDPVDVLRPESGSSFAITGELGVGGMKIVHRAHDHHTDRDVALAMLQNHVPRSSNELRFLREARITAALEHPNIVPVHTIGVDAANCPYFTMKLIGGESLRDILKHLEESDPSYIRQYPLDRLLAIFQGVCQAIAFAHSRGVVHLDIKPANIQVGNFGEVLVLDWGLAKILETSDPAGPETTVHLPEILREAATEGIIRGTPGYMAPEQERGEFQSLDERTDVFALGALLKVILQDQRTLRQAPAALQAVAAKAMAADPQQRYPRADLLLQDVRAFIAGYAVSAQPVGLATLVWLMIKRHKAVTIVLLTSLLTITTLLTVFVWRLKRSEQRALDTLTQLAVEQADKARIGRYATPHMLNLARQSIKNSRYDEAMVNLEMCLAVDDSVEEAWRLKGALHLGRQEFDKAMAAFDRVPLWAQRIQPDKKLRPAELARQYQRMAGPGGELTEGQALLFMKDVMSRFSTEYRDTVFRQFFHRRNSVAAVDAEHLAFIHQALGVFNPPTTNVLFGFQTDENGLAIEIHGARVSQLLPLHGLRMQSLDLSGTYVADLRWIADSGLTKLDLSGKRPDGESRINELAPIVGLPLAELRLVRCSKVDIDQLRFFPKLEKVVVSMAKVAEARNILSKAAIKAEVVGE